MTRREKRWQWVRGKLVDVTMARGNRPRCPICRKMLTEHSISRYCSDACREIEYRWRRAGFAVQPRRARRQFRNAGALFPLRRLDSMVQPPVGRAGAARVGDR
jgi:hypothetical protein